MAVCGTLTSLATDFDRPEMSGVAISRALWHICGGKSLPVLFPKRPCRFLLQELLGTTWLTFPSSIRLAVIIWSSVLVRSTGGL